MTRRVPVPKVVICGVGRLGGALALRLQQAGWPVTVVARTGASKKRARELKLTLATARDIAGARLCVLTVPDASVAKAARALEPKLGGQAALVHCAGALDLSAFGETERARGSFHPLVAISDAHDLLAGHGVAVAASAPAVELDLNNMARALAMRPLSVPELGRAAYHAAAVMSAGLVVSLIDAAIEAAAGAGVDPEEAEQALLALTASAIRGAQARGVRASLTGPIIRGDVAVVESHLESLPPHLAVLYRDLSARALALSGDRLPAATADALAALLG